jgi:hypothetical protein
MRELKHDPYARLAAEQARNKAQNKPDVRINMTDAMKNLTLTVSIIQTRRFKVRYWLGLRIMYFGAWVIGIGHRKTEIS